MIYCLPRKEVVHHHFINTLFYDCSVESKELLQKVLSNLEQNKIIQFITLCSQCTNVGRFALTFNCALNDILKCKNDKDCEFLLQQDISFSLPEFFDNERLSESEIEYLNSIYKREYKVMELLYEHCLENNFYQDDIFPCYGRENLVCSKNDSLYSKFFEEVCSVEFNGREDYFMLCGGDYLPSSVYILVGGKMKKCDIFDVLPEIVEGTLLVDNIEEIKEKYKIELKIFERFLKKK